MFKLHPQLAKDCVVLEDLPLCQVLLMNDSQYPWLILVPRHNDIEEIFQLNLEDQQQLQRESSSVAAAMMAFFKADKMNVAALGNVVPQLHIHHIARFKTDGAWPKPVWGVNPPVSYPPNKLEKTVSEFRELLQNCHF